MIASTALFLLYRSLRDAVDRLGLARVPVVGGCLVRPLGALARRAIVLGAEMSTVEVRGHRIRLGPNTRANSLRSSDALFHYISFARDEYERGTTQVFEDRIEAGMTVVDVGAHVGYYTLIAARKVGPSGRVVAFEPDPTNFGLLCENVRLNGYDNVTPVQMAVCDRSGTVAMFLSRLDSMDHSLYRVPHASDSSVSVAATRLDDFLCDERWPRADFIKIDAEGAEPAILRGMRVLAERTARLTLVVECNPFTLAAVGVTRGQLLQQIRSLGFEVKMITDTGLADVDAGRLERLRRGVNLLCIKGLG